MLNLQRLAMFVAVVEAGSFTGAAQSLGQTRAVVSVNLKQLEKELGVALLVRTTRQLALTDAGERFYAHSQQLLRAAEAALEEVRGEHQGYQGTLHVASTPEYGAHAVVPVLAAFARHHPELRIRHSSSSQHTDLVAARVDVAIRLGNLRDSSHHAARIGRFRILPVAAKAYLARHPVQDLAGLAQAHWIAHSRLASPLNWPVKTPEGHTVAFDVAGGAAWLADSAAALLTFVLAGSGVALLPDWLVQPLVREQRLTVLLPDHRFPSQAISALYPNTRHIPEKVRAFIDFFKARTQAERES
ncbi:LysR family transcriptional regulator [Chimaeribacter arupi]|uniref:LysR family transcriptional regulator n=1 Tax=Chimaeribacter arupi TaxID=2060066 RepID=A0A2N5ENM7_9GAMM|nr:LysR family transcriptional regulator [Chimaeribacter arupi]PLR50278.1 LysR family transcriptional regulator [Chimaeribacter arupi]